LTAPSARGQRAVLQAACRNADVAPAAIGYVEAQGTGTVLGDAIEAEALGAVLGSGRGLEASCAIGSLKSNIGHLEAAAGAAAVAKTALALHHRALPPSVHAGQPRTDIPFDLLGLRLQSALEPWPSDAALLAGVSAFGFGGTNAHVVLSAA
jgi:acyl transferase domain-containing protein